MGRRLSLGRLAVHNLVVCHSVCLSELGFTRKLHIDTYLGMIYSRVRIQGICITIRNV